MAGRSSPSDTYSSVDHVARERSGSCGRLRRGFVAVALLLVAFSSRVAAHPGHESHDGNEFEVALLLFVLGIGFLGIGVAAQEFSDVPEPYGKGMLVGGGVLLLVATPLVWWFWGL